MISLGIFLFFFILFFWVARGVKGQKITQNGKTLSVMVHISGIIHHMLVLYGTLEWNNISWHFFHLFNFDVVRGVKGRKKSLSVALHFSISLEPYIIYDHHLWYVSVKWYFLFFFFFHFLKILIFQVVRKFKEQKWPKVTKNLFVPYISGTMHYIIFIYCTHV